MPRRAAPGLGRRIRTIREQRNIKLAALAKHAGISMTQMQKIETVEGIAPSGVTLYYVADALNCSMAQLLGLPEPGPRSHERQTMPSTLQRAQQRFRLTMEDVEFLRSLEYRGRRPQTEEDWFTLLGVIRRLTG